MIVNIAMVQAFRSTRLPRWHLTLKVEGQIRGHNSQGQMPSKVLKHISLGWPADYKWLSKNTIGEVPSPLPRSFIRNHYSAQGNETQRVVPHRQHITSCLFINATGVGCDLC